MTDFYGRVLGWATDRNIIKGSKWQKQRTKTWEELTELAEGLSKSKLDLAKDAIGDCFVTVTNMAGCMGLNILELAKDAENWMLTRKAKFDHYDTDGLMNLFIQHVSVVRNHDDEPGPLDVVTEFVPEYHFTMALAALGHCALRLELSPSACQEHAWNEIKDRKGMMISGTFVKEKDLPTSFESIVKREAAALANDHESWMYLWISSDNLITEEQYCDEFQRRLRERLAGLIDGDTFGLHVDGETKITHAGKSDFFDSLETMSLVVNAVFFVEADSKPIQVTIVQSVSGTVSAAKVVEPTDYQVNVWELDFEDIQLVRRYGMSGMSPDELGEMLVNDGRLPEHTTKATVTAEYFDNEIPFFAVHFTSDDGELVYHVAALTLI